ncbi:MAG: hypothetical protein WBN17_03765, partial [Aureibaculum sp.]
MQLRQTYKINDLELPIEIYVSFEKVFSHYKNFLKDKEHPNYKLAKLISKEVSKYPELIHGIK